MKAFFKNKTNKITDPALLCCDYSRERHLNWPIILCCCPIKLVATEIFDVSNCFTRSDCWLPLHNNSKPITNNRLVLPSHSRNKHIICSEPRMTLGIINGIFFLQNFLKSSKIYISDDSALSCFWNFRFIGLIRKSIRSILLTSYLRWFDF